MESYISKDVPEQGPLTEGSTSPIAEGRIVVETVDLDLLWENAKKTGLLFEDTVPYVDPSPDFHKTRVVAPPPRRRVDTAIRKTICAILHKPSGAYVEKGFRRTTWNPEHIKFWNRKADAKKVLSAWFSRNSELADKYSLDDFEFVEREVFLPSSEAV